MTGQSALLTGPDAARLVQAAARITSIPELRLAIIGGVAVACRVGTLFRATTDVDAVSAELAYSTDSVASSADLLVVRDIATRVPRGAATDLSVDGTTVQIIDTEPIPPDVRDIEPALSRLFVQAHRFALDSAEPMPVVVHDPEVEARIPVAITVALIATKLHALADRHDDAKKASDAHDLTRLLGLVRSSGGPDRLAEAPGLAETIADVMDDVLVENAERAVRYMHVYGDHGLPQFDAEEVRLRASSFVRMIRS